MVKSKRVFSPLKGVESEEPWFVLFSTTLLDEPRKDLRITQRLTDISARFVRAQQSRTERTGNGPTREGKRRGPRRSREAAKRLLLAFPIHLDRVTLLLALDLELAPVRLMQRSSDHTG
jgi:hypothetical protein